MLPDSAAPPGLAARRPPSPCASGLLGLGRHPLPHPSWGVVPGRPLPHHRARAPGFRGAARIRFRNRHPSSARSLRPSTAPAWRAQSGAPTSTPPHRSRATSGSQRRRAGGAPRARRDSALQPVAPEALAGWKAPRSQPAQAPSSHPSRAERPEPASRMAGEQPAGISAIIPPPPTPPGSSRNIPRARPRRGPSIIKNSPSRGGRIVIVDRARSPTPSPLPLPGSRGWALRSPGAPARLPLDPSTPRHGGA